MSEVASFDVFDTTLTRLIGSPRQVFVETGRRLRTAGVVDVEPAAYAAVRERVLTELTTDIGRHPTLATVLAEVASRLNLPSRGVADLVATELAVESDELRAVPGMVERLAAERGRTGRGVLFVSDTPLPSEFLHDVLRREGLSVTGDRLYTSSAAGASKQQGGLYDVVRADEGVPAGAIVHVGDDEEADVTNARLHGWRAASVTAARLTTVERRLDARAPTTDGLGARLAGLILVSRDDLRPVSATGQRPARLDALQRELQQGPCIDAARSQEVIVVAKLEGDPRWNGLHEAAVELGVVSLACVPLRVGHRTTGALSLYSAEIDAFEGVDLAYVQLFATLAALALADAQRADQLRTALASRDVLGQAKGILMERLRVGADEAFARLSTASQTTNTKVTAVAEHLVRTGELLEPGSRVR